MLAAVMPASPPPRRRWLLPGLAGLAVLLLAAGGVYVFAGRNVQSAEPTVAASPTPTSIRVTGHLTLYDVNLDWKTSRTCEGDGGYGDIRYGARVVVTDAAGKTVALDSLGAGTVIDPLRACMFSFSVDVPTGLGFYGVAIGGRKAYQLKESDLSASVELTLGGN